MFISYPTYARYRTLRLLKPYLKGEDVYAFQIAIDRLGAKTGGFDGVFGPQTEKATLFVQNGLGVVVDGLAGIATQTAIVKILCGDAAIKHNLPNGLVFGHVKLESGCWVGNYSPLRADGTYDAGVAQRNTKYTDSKEGFDPVKSIEALGLNERHYFDLYKGVTPTTRRWELAVGAWNAPAFANYIAREEGATQVRVANTLKPTTTQRSTFEDYMAIATKEMVL